MQFEGISPKIAASAMVFPTACIMGQVSLSEHCSAFPGAVLRGDEGMISIGERTNLQDIVIIHGGTRVGCDVTVGHGAILHNCTVGDRVIIGMGAVLLDGAVVEDDCIIAAGTLLPPGRHVPSGSMAMGSPGIVKRALTDEEIHLITTSAQHYVDLIQRWKASF